MVLNGRLVQFGFRLPGKVQTFLKEFPKEKVCIKNKVLAIKE
jgi:hypothetical protein